MKLLKNQDQNIFVSVNEKYEYATFTAVSFINENQNPSIDNIDEIIKVAIPKEKYKQILEKLKSFEPVKYIDIDNKSLIEFQIFDAALGRFNLEVSIKLSKCSISQNFKDLQFQD